MTDDPSLWPNIIDATGHVLTFLLPALITRWRPPKKSLGWYRQMQSDFAALPED